MRARASAMPVQPPCSSAQVAKSLSVLSRARIAGSFRRSANLAGPPSRIHSGKNAFQPWNIAVYGILVRRDVESARARRLELGDVGVDRAPERHAADLEVEDVDRNLGLGGDPNRVVELALLLVALAAGVRGVVAAVARHRACHLEHFLGMLGAAALEACHQAPRPFLHRSRHQVDHLLALGRRGRLGVVAHDHAAHLLGGDVRDRVDRRSPASPGARSTRCRCASRASARPAPAPRGDRAAPPTCSRR